MRSPLVWNNPHTPGGRVLIEPEPLLVMDAHWQNMPDIPESGGILMGYRRGEHLHVTFATPPQTSDTRKRYQFLRSAGPHQEIALKHWRASEWTVDYLGEWHTHPQARPEPSTVDHREWRKIYRGKVLSMLFAVMGWDGQLWLGLSSANTVAQCEPSKSSDV
jgi:integrative and conjugative element protein (TIGR02256 family)